MKFFLATLLFACAIFFEFSLSAPVDNPPKDDVSAEPEKNEHHDRKQQDEHGDTGGHGHGNDHKHHEHKKSHKHHKHHSHHGDHGSAKKPRHDGDNKKHDITKSPKPTGLSGTAGLPGQSGSLGRTGFGLPIGLPPTIGQYDMPAQNPRFGQQQQQLLNRVPQNSLPSGQTQQSTTPTRTGTPTAAGQLGAQRAQSVNLGITQTQPSLNPGLGPSPTQAHSSGQGLDPTQAQSFGQGLKNQALLNSSQAGTAGQLGSQGTQLGTQGAEAVNPVATQTQTKGLNLGQDLSSTQAQSSGPGLKNPALLNPSKAGIAGQLGSQGTQGAEAVNPGVTQTQTKGLSPGQGITPTQAQSSGPGLKNPALLNPAQAGTAGQLESQGTQGAEAVNPGVNQAQTKGLSPGQDLSSTQAQSSGPGLKNQALLNPSQAGIAGQLGTQGAQAVNPGAAQIRTQDQNPGQGLNPAQAQSSGPSSNAALSQSSSPSLNPIQAQNSRLGLNPTQAQRPGGAGGAEGAGGEDSE